MLDFYRIEEKEETNGRGNLPIIKVFPSFLGRPSEDLMIRGGDFYAVWDEVAGLWSTDLRRLIRIVDDSLRSYIDKMPEDRREQAHPQFMEVHRTNMLSAFLRYVREMNDSYHQTDQVLIFQGEDSKKDDYATKRLPYSLCEGETKAYSELVGCLFNPDELQKLEWAVGSVIAGDSRYIQKFVVLFGDPGTGKSTYTKLIEKLFEGYTAPFKAQDLGNSNKQFALSAFKDGPLVGIEHDGRLDQLHDNTVINSIVSHDLMEVNEKHKSQYAMRFNVFMFMGTNGFVKITNAQSGLMRRLIDVQSSGRKHSPDRYFQLWDQVQFELGAIAYHCREVYLKLGRNYYDSYRPMRMLYGTNTVHNFVDQYAMDFEEAEYVTLNQVFVWYTHYCQQNGENYPRKKHELANDLVPYFHEFHRRTRQFGDRQSNVFVGFKTEMMGYEAEIVEEPEDDEIKMTETDSGIDLILADCPAQYANEKGTPSKKWDDVTTTLKDLDTTRLHFVIPPLNHIVIDFDLKDESGEKSRQKNLDAVAKWPPTYSEWSKSGSGIHLHYLYEGDVEKLARLFSPHIEVKVFVGKASLRRKLTECRNLPVATLTSGLPIREERMINQRQIKSERSLRSLVERNLRKEIHPGTKPSVDFIHKILKEAYESGMVYDLTDMKSRVVAFAMNSTNQSIYCLKLTNDMKFKSDGEMKEVSSKDDTPVIFDVEVFPNLFVVCWSYEDSDEVVSMVNPTPKEIGQLLEMKLIGFYNRQYDNHILWARFMGYDNEQLYDYSSRLVGGDNSLKFGSAYNVSYTDIYDYLSKKQSLKKWQIELGLHHKESGLPWTEPVPDDKIEEVVEYCKNDVVTTKQLRRVRQADWMARQILSELSGLSVNHSTNSHSARIIFGTERKPQGEFIYTDLAETFPGYKFEFGKSSYRGMDPSEGGFVYAEPGMYENVTVFDVSGMHPSSIIALNLFGDRYTKRFSDLVSARLAIKHGDTETAGELLGGVLKPYLGDKDQLKGLSDALKIVVNSVYGLTSASFDNPFKDPRNLDNVVAKRGALFMIELLKTLQDRGVQVIHIKTDSIKLANVDEELKQFVYDFGAKYGYTFEVENEYEKLCLVNNAVYVGKHHNGVWDAVGAQFQHPVVYKMLFDPDNQPEFDDFVEVKSVQTSMWLDFDGEKRFIGRFGSFVPVYNGGTLLREKDGKFHAVSGTKGYKWQEAEEMRAGSIDNEFGEIDVTYFDHLVNDAREKLAEFGDVAEFLDN